MSRTRVAWVLMAAACAFAGAVRAESAQRLHVAMSTAGRTELLIWQEDSVDRTCAPLVPGVTLEILQAPRHGVARISDDPFYPGYRPENPRSACNLQKVPGHQAFYVAKPGFVGRDRVLLRNVSSQGRVREITVEINVR